MGNRKVKILFIMACLLAFFQLLNGCNFRNNEKRGFYDYDGFMYKIPYRIPIIKPYAIHARVPSEEKK